MVTNESLEYFPFFNPQVTNPEATASVAIGSTVAAMGAPDAIEGCGAVTLYAYSEESNAWAYIGVLLGAAIEGIEQVRNLGSTCLAFGDTVIVGAKGDAATPGRVFVLTPPPPYRKWAYSASPLIAELAAPEPAKGDEFGAALSHCFDGESHYIAVGAPAAAPPIGVTAGSGQVFVYRGLEASNQPFSSTILNPSEAGGATDRFGASVAINTSGDGTGKLVLAVGAPGAKSGKGTVYVGRTAESGSWPATLELVELGSVAASAATGNGFGSALAMTGGVTLVVGNPNESASSGVAAAPAEPASEGEAEAPAEAPSAGEIEGAGAVWIFNDQDGTFVSADVTLRGDVKDSKFGTSVAFMNSGITPADSLASTQSPYLIVGAPGAERAFRYANDPVDGAPAGKSFTQDGEYGAVNSKAGDSLGFAVAGSVFANGSWTVAGAPGKPKDGQPGGAFLYVDSEQAPTWMDPPKLISKPTLRWGGLSSDWWVKWTPQVTKYL